MSKHIIFLIHGMGVHKSGWSKEVQDVTKDAYKNNVYKKLKTRPFDDFYEFNEVIYDDIVETQRERWKQDSTAVLTRIVAGGAASDIVETAATLGAATNEDNFFNTHLLDVLLYRFISLIRDPIRVRVGKQIFDKLNSVPDTQKINWSFIAHSLGTIVAHDTMHLMFHDESGFNTNHLERKNFGPTVGLFASNVSRLLQSEIDVYDTSMVRPSRFKKNGILEFYINANHKLDPFPKPKRFQPDEHWMNQETRTKVHRRYQDISISEINDPNVHSLTHYMANPAVHIPFFRALFERQNIIRNSEENIAIEKYREETRKKQFSALRRELLALVESEGPEVSDFLKATKKFIDIVRA